MIFHKITVFESNLSLKFSLISMGSFMFHLSVCSHLDWVDRKKISKFLIEWLCPFNLDQWVNIADCSDRGQGEET